MCLSYLSLSSRRAWIEITVSFGEPTTSTVSLSSRRAWIEIKYLFLSQITYRMSLSSRRAWIEIKTVVANSVSLLSLSSRRAWIEITICLKKRGDKNGRSPHGERGLKYDNKSIAKWLIESLSSRRAWIEISSHLDTNEK